MFASHRAFSSTLFVSLLLIELVAFPSALQASDISKLKIVEDCITVHGGRQAMEFKDVYVNIYVPGGMVKAYWRKPNMFKLIYVDETSRGRKSAALVGDKIFGEKLNIHGYNIFDFARIVPLLSLSQLTNEHTLRTKGRSYVHDGTELTEVSQQGGIVSLINQDNKLCGVRYTGPAESDYTVISLGQHIKLGDVLAPKRVEIKKPRLPALQMTIRCHSKDQLKNEDTFFSDPKERPKRAKKRRKNRKK